MHLELIKDKKAAELLTDSHFCQKWEALYGVCPWATVFQSHQFASIWYEVYKEEYSLVFVIQQDGDGKLTGFLPLAEEKSTGNIYHVGTYHAEYQGWLASGDDGDAFIKTALELLSHEFRGKKLDLLFLCPNIPVGWAQDNAPVAKKCIVSQHLRPIVELDKTEKFTKSLKKRNNKNHLKQLGKHGEIRIETIKDKDGLEEVFETIDDFSKLRISAIHGAEPVKDKGRKQFHLSLMEKSELLEISLLKAGDEIASAQMLINNEDGKLMAMISLSPFLSGHSPSSLHISMLAIELAQTNTDGIFDLSPGEGYKERFATKTEPVYSLHAYFDSSELLKNKAMVFLRKTAEKTLNKYFVDKADKIKRAAKRYANVLEMGQGEILEAIAGKVKRFINENLEMRIYAMNVADIANLPRAEMMNHDSINDLLKYSRAERHQLSRSEFHKVVLDRFGNRAHSYTFSEGERLLHFGWMLERQKESYVNEVGQAFTMPDDSAVLFDYFTHPEARGRGLYKNSLLQGLHDAAMIPGMKKVFISVLADNGSSRHVIEKLGFEYQGSLFRKKILGKVKKWQEWKKDIFAEPEKISEERRKEGRISVVPALVSSQANPDTSYQEFR